MAEVSAAVLRALYTAALAHHSVAIWWLLRPKDLAGVTEPTTLNLQRYPCRFFTGWNLVAQTAFLCACLLEDLTSGWRTKTALARLLKDATDIVFWALVFPGTIFVSTVFWSLFAVDRELVYPAAIDAVLPWWLNHAMHTDIVAVLALGLCLQRRRSPPRAMGLAAVCVYALAYNCAFLHAYFDGNVWIYPLFGKVGAWPNQLFLLLAANVLCVLLYFLGEHLNSKMWSASASLQRKNFQKYHQKQNGELRSKKFL